MSPQYSIIVPALLGAESELPDWIGVLESETVELLVSPIEKVEDTWLSINAAIEYASGSYCCIIDPAIEISTPHWIELLLAYLETSEADILGVSGIVSLSLRKGDIGFEGKPVALHSSIAPNTTVDWGTVFRKNGVKEAVALEGQILFARREFFQRLPMHACDTRGQTDPLTRYSFRLGIEEGERLGILTGVDYSELRTPPQSLDQKNASDLSKDQRYQHFCPIDTQNLGIWQHNLNALKRIDPIYAQSLFFFLPFAGEYHFTYHKPGKVTAKGATSSALVVDNIHEIDQLPPSDTVMLLGIGSGALVEQLLRKTQCEVLIVEPEYRLIVELLKHFDWSDAIAEKRLIFLPIARGNAVIEQLSLSLSARQLQALLLRNLNKSIVIRGYSFHLNYRYFEHMENAMKLALEQRAVAQSCGRLSKKVFDVTVVSPRCEIFSDLANCFSTLGFRTRIFNVPDKLNQLSRPQFEELMMQLITDGSDLTLYRNRSFIETEQLTTGSSCEAYIPGKQLSWWWDVPNVASFIDWYDPSCQLPALGFANDLLSVLPSGSAWLPPGARTQFSDAPLNQTKPKQYDISFVGQSRVDLIESNLLILKHSLETYCGVESAGLLEPLVKFTSFTQLYENLTVLEDDVRGCISELSEVMPPQGYYLNYLFKMSKTAVFRVAAIEQLVSSGFRVKVFGGDDWMSSGIITEAEYGGVAASAALVDIYQSSRVNLNLNFMQVSSTVNPKVLDIAACGGVVLTDWKPELDILYPDIDIRPCSFRGLDDMLLKVSDILQGAEQQSLGVMERTRTHHSLLNRAAWIAEKYLQSP